MEGEYPRGFSWKTLVLQMGRIGEIIGIDFVISTGDNFYGSGLKNEHDPKFTESFTRIYTAKSLQRQWYILGNHDYRGNVIAQLSPALKKRDNRWLCWRSFVVDAGVAEIFFVDTTPFVLSYWDPNSSVKHDWRDLALNKSSATWKVVVGHHGIKSAGYHGDTAELLMHLLPVLQANDVDFYVNGHDHCLQHIEDTNSKLQFFTSGAGSKAWRGYTGGLKRPDLKFYYDGQGFMSVQLGHSNANISFHDINDKDQGLDVISEGLDTLKDMAQDMNEDINIQDGCGTKFLLCRTRLFLGALFQYKSLDESSFTSGIMEVFEPATRVAAPALKPAIKFFWLFC
ncbi:hypothetical protein Droror1_Dr00026738 [Drosera rotundifolia]